MLFSEKFFEAEFKAPTYKGAYLKACNWLGKNVMGQKDLSVGITWTIVKNDANDSGVPSVTLTLYATLEEKEFVYRFCRVCKEFHSSFYINQQQNCNNCNMQAYRGQILEKINMKQKYKREILDKNVSP